MTEKMHQPELEQKPPPDAPPELKPVEEWLSNELASKTGEVEAMIHPGADVLRTVAKLEEGGDDPSPADEDSAHEQAVDLVSEGVRRKKEIQGVNIAFGRGDYGPAL